MSRNSRVAQSRLEANRAVQPALAQLRNLRLFRGSERDTREITGHGRAGPAEGNGNRPRPPRRPTR